MTTKLVGVHPDLVAKITRVLDVMASVGHPMIVTDGLRTMPEQAALWRKGRVSGNPGPIVTNCDGIQKRSNHQMQADHFGHAVDCAFVVDGAPSWDESLPWLTYGTTCESEHLIWGGRWKTPDKPHCELPVLVTGDPPLKA